MSSSSRKLRPQSRFPNLFARSAPAVLEDVPESVEEVDALASPTLNMLQQQRSSRMYRLSKFLPSLKTQTKTETESKALEDPFSRDPAPAPASYRQSSPHRPPTRDAPSAPYAMSTQPLQPPPSIPSSKRLQKVESPSRLKAQHSPRTQSPARSAGTQVQNRFGDDSLVPPPALTDVGQGRSTSSPINSRPNSSHSGSESDAGLTSKLRKRTSWIPGGGRSRSRSRNPSQDSDIGHPKSAWIKTGANTIDYSLTLLVNGEKVPELWTEDSDTFVYLFPRSAGRGPSFRVPAIILSTSQILLELVHGDVYAGGHSRAKSFDGRGSLAVEDASRNLPIRGVGALKTVIPDNQSSSDGSTGSMRSLTEAPKENHLFFPSGIMSTGPQLSAEDVQRLVEIRNLFAFLTGQPLVATRHCPETFGIFLAVASLLKQLEFTNFDGSSFGESAATSFNLYLDALRLSDVRDSREKTIEGIVLGESMRSIELYNESFAHAVGKYDSIKSLQSPIFNQISPNTRNRLERAYMDLQQRQASVALRLTTFEFPSLFAGIASSTSSEESKYIRFKAWKSHFLAMRKQVLAYYKDLHGQWPPKASSKKNQFVEGGLNRLVLKVLYNDLCQLYSLLVDRASITTRSYDEADHEDASVDPTHSALRRLLSEYDRSSPPVQPPVPFDVPLVPTVASVNPSFVSLSPKEQNKESSRKLKKNETMLVLAKSHNIGAEINTPFLKMYREFELNQSHHKNAQELADQRYGHWIFLYAVIQALPMLVVDAPGVRFTEGVEYFLCEPPMGNAPWLEDAPGVKMAWYGIQGGQGVVSMPSDIVNHGVEAVYRRSNCWVMAEQWIGSDVDTSSMQPPFEAATETLSPLEPPPGLAGGELGVRPQSRGRQPSPSTGGWDNGVASNSLTPQDTADRRSRSRKNRQSIALGLERLPIPDSHDSWSPNVAPVSGGPYSASRGDSPAGYPSNMSASGQAGRTPVSGTSAGRGSTFDDILGSLEQEQQEKPKGKSKKK